MPIPKSFFLILIFASLLATAVGQAKPNGELDVARCWSYPMENGSGSMLASEPGRVFIGSVGARIDALSPDGKVLWSSELGGDFSSNLLPTDSGLYLVTSTATPGSDTLRSLSKETGITAWTLKIPDAEQHFLHGVNGSVLVVSKNGVIQSIDAKSGSVKWRREIAEGFVAEPTFTADKVLVAAAGGRIFSVLLNSGEIDSMRKAPFAVTALGESQTGEIIAGDERGNIISLLNNTEKPVWKYKSGGQISNLFTIGGFILAASHDNFVYYLNGRNGDVAWKKRLGGRVSQIGNINNHVAVMSSVDENGAVVADLATGKVAGMILFADDETPVFEPSSDNGLIFILTNKAAYAYALNGCELDRNGGPAKIAATANLK